MSGALGFIRANPATAGYDQQEERTHRRRTRDQAQDTDRAIREGVAEMGRQQPAAGLGGVQAAPVAQAAPAPAPMAQPASSGAWAPDDRYFSTLEAQESGGNPNARNPRSSATGPYQFIDSTWRSYVAAQPEVFAGMTPEQTMAARTDPRFARMGVEWLTRQNTDTLRQQGLPADAGSAGLAHVFGAQGAATLLRADPNAPIDTVMSPQVIAANPHLRGRTVGQVRQTFTARYGGGGGAEGVAFTASGQQPALAGVSAPQPQQPMPVPQNPYGPMLARLSATPGAGATALNVMLRGEGEVSRRMQAQARMANRTGIGGMTASAQNAAERNVLYALGHGHIDVAQSIAQRIGMTIPPEILNNAQARVRFATAGEIIQRQYPNDPEQGRAFMRSYLQHGDPMRAMADAGPPASRPGNWQPLWIKRDHDEVLGMFNRATGQLAYAQQPGASPTAPGQPPAAAAPAPAPAAGAPPSPDTPGSPFVTRAPRAGSASKAAAMQVRRDILVRSGMSEQEADAIAGGARMSPAQISAARIRAWEGFRRAASQDINAWGMPQGFSGTPEQAVEARVQRDMAAWDAMMGAAPAPETRDPPAAGTPDAPFAPATRPAASAPPPPRPTSVPRGAAWSAARQQWRDPQGNLYDANGARVGAR